MNEHEPDAESVVRITVAFGCPNCNHHDVAEIECTAQFQPVHCPGCGAIVAHAGLDARGESDQEPVYAIDASHFGPIQHTRLPTDREIDDSLAKLPDAVRAIWGERLRAKVKGSGSADRGEA
jgi:hypothetical protein